MTKSVFITGGATGIGRATALLFARQGYFVGAYDIDEARLDILNGDIKAVGGRGVVGHLDVTDADEVAQRLSEFHAAAGGRLDVLINNAGLLNAGRFENIPLDVHHREIEVNVKGVVNGLHGAFPFLKSTPGAVVVNLASASAIYGQAELANYSATKFFVRAITEALNLEWGRYGIRVIDMWPLYVNTAMTRGVKTGTTDSLGIRLTAEDIADEHPGRSRSGVAAQGTSAGALPRGGAGKGTGRGGTILPGVAHPAGQQAARTPVVITPSG